MNVPPVLGRCTNTNLSVISTTQNSRQIRKEIRDWGGVFVRSHASPVLGPPSKTVRLLELLDHRGQPTGVVL